MNALISASLYHGHSVSYFHQMRINHPKRFEYLTNLGEGDIQKGYTIYKTTIVENSQGIISFLYSLREEEEDMFLKEMNSRFTKKAEKAVFKRVDQISFKEHLLLIEINEVKEEIARKIRE